MAKVTRILGCLVVFVVLYCCRQLHTDDTVNRLAQRDRELISDGGDGIVSVDNSTRGPFAVVHVGPHKTASTSIQADLCRMTGQLRLAGWDYPMCEQCVKAGECGKRSSHASIAFQLKNNSAKQAVFCRERDAIRCFGDTVGRLASDVSIVLSSEEFSSLNLEQIKSLKAMLNGYRVKIVYFYRSKKQALVSLFHQMASKNTEDFATIQNFLFTIEGLKPPMPTLFAKESLGAYASVFGPESVTVISYDNMMEQAHVQPISALIAAFPGGNLTELERLALDAGNSSHANLSRDPDVYPLLSYLKTLAVSNKHQKSLSTTAGAQKCQMDLLAKFVKYHGAALPRICSSITLLLEPWEEAERSFLYSQPFDLRHFDTFPYSDSGDLCILDTGKLTAHWSTWGVKLIALLDRLVKTC